MSDLKQGTKISESSPSFVVYIDESGDEGFVFRRALDQGSSEWFVLSAVIVRATEDLHVVKLVDGIRKRLNKPVRSAIHFRKLKHERRLPFVARIAEAQLRIVNILVHKPSLQEPEKFQRRYVLYRYATRYLLERVSWFCRDHRRRQDVGDGSARVVFSNRAGMSYGELYEYLDHLRNNTNFFNVQIDWDVIKCEQIRAVGHDKLMGLQIADAVASSFFFGLQRGVHGFIEPRYAQMLKPVVYNRQGRYLGYGMKFWPRDVGVLEGVDQNLRWIAETYT